MLKKLNKLKSSRKINNYFHDQLFAKSGIVPTKMEEQLISEAISMTSIGVSSEDDHKNFLYIKQHTRKIAEDILKRKVDLDTLAKISYIVFSNVENNPISSIFNFYIAVDKAMRKLGFSIKKIAYPSGEDNWRAENPHDIKKWMYSMREIYIKSNRGMGFNKALNIVTGDWDKMEKQDFKNWLRYYQEGSQFKYKTAQREYYQLEGEGAPMIPVDHLRAGIPKLKGPGMPSMEMFDYDSKLDEKAKVEESSKLKKEEVKDRKAEIRKKILSRINSIEKMVTDPYAQEDLSAAIDMDLNTWLETLHSLKRIIQAPVKGSESSTILEDLMVRKGNQLKHQGYVKAGEFIIRLSQGAPKPTPVEELDNAPPEEEFNKQPVENDMEEMLPPEDLETLPENDNKAMHDFVKSMNNALSNEEEEEDESYTDDLMAVAQAISPPEEMIEDALKPAPEVSIPEIEVKNIVENNVNPGGNKHLKAVIDELEVAASILRKREIPRILAKVDIGLDELGFAEFFPVLAEAQKSALESNQYMSTRVDDVLSKLRGALESNQSIEFIGEANDVPDSIEQIRDSLQNSEEAELHRQERRKKRQGDKEVAKVEREQAIKELANPVDIKTGPPARATI